MIIFPHAKINIGLDIIRRRDDGYHDIATVMVPTGWEDVLELTPAENTSLHVTGRKVDCPPEKNLVMKALRALETATGGIPSTRIHLHKIIPDGAGLGGGSADAAFTLLGLNRLYDLGLSGPDLMKIAAGIGADCPFFIADTPMLCTGTGTTMTEIDLPQLAGLTLAIVKPPVSVPTAEAYSRVTPSEPAVSLESRLLSLPVDRWQQSVGNDFEKSVLPRYPQIAHIKSGLLAGGAVYSAMSGSGSAVFGLFESSGADILAEHLKGVFPDCTIHCGTL